MCSGHPHVSAACEQGQTGGLLLMRYPSEAASKPVLVDRWRHGKMMERRVANHWEIIDKYIMSDPICRIETAMVKTWYWYVVVMQKVLVSVLYKMTFQVRNQSSAKVFFRVR